MWDSFWGESTWIWLFSGFFYIMSPAHANIVKGQIFQFIRNKFKKKKGWKQVSAASDCRVDTHSV